jgi:hypothetical protein
MDQCCKLHGFPLGYNTRGKSPTANQVSLSNIEINVASTINKLSPLQLTQIQAQYEQILTLLNTKTMTTPMSDAILSSTHHQAFANVASSFSLPAHLGGVWILYSK